MGVNKKGFTQITSPHKGNILCYHIEDSEKKTNAQVKQ